VTAGRWAQVGTVTGMAVLVGGAVFLATTSDSPQGGPSPRAETPFSPRDVATPGPAEDAGQAQHPRIADRAQVGTSPLDRDGNKAARPAGASNRDQLKSYEQLWVDPDVARLRAAEQRLLARLRRLPPADLVALLGKGTTTRSANLILITLQNAMRGPRRIAYENALLLEMEAAHEQPEKLTALSDIALSLDLSPRNAAAVKGLLEKTGLNRQ
jgi:hypothetical protein